VVRLTVGHSRAVQEVTELIDTQSQVGADQPVVRRVGVGAGVCQAAAPRADGGKRAVAVNGVRGGAAARHRAAGDGHAAIQQVEAETVGPVLGIAALVPFIGHRLERDLQALPGREWVGRYDRAVLFEAAGVFAAYQLAAIGEAQRALVPGIDGGRRGARAEEPVLPADQVLAMVVAALDAYATGQEVRSRRPAQRLAGIGARAATAGRQACAVEVEPGVAGRVGSEVLAEIIGGLGTQHRGREQRQQHGETSEEAQPSGLQLLHWTPCWTENVLSTTATVFASAPKPMASIWNTSPVPSAETPRSLMWKAGAW